MSIDPQMSVKIIGSALSGKGAHVLANQVFEGLGWKPAGTRLEGAPHTIFQLLNHIAYWQEWVVKWLDGKPPAIPKHASGSWPGEAAPTSSREWKAAVRRFKKGLEDLTRRSHSAEIESKRRGKSPLEMLLTIASHNSYHLGQVVQLRQMLDAWPPPSGGLTW